jgi:hypothetical protein
VSVLDEVPESSFPKLITIRVVNVFCQLPLRDVETGPHICTSCLYQARKTSRKFLCSGYLLTWNIGICYYFCESGKWTYQMNLITAAFLLIYTFPFKIINKFKCSISYVCCTLRYGATQSITGCNAQSKLETLSELRK